MLYCRSIIMGDGRAWDGREEIIKVAFICFCKEYTVGCAVRSLIPINVLAVYTELFCVKLI